MVSVDAGGFFRPQGPDAGPINALMLEALEELPIHVLNLTADDLHVWPLLSRTPLGRSQVISTNLQPRSGEGGPAPYAVIPLTWGGHETRVGFLGVTDPRKVPPNSGFVGEDPLPAVARVVESVSPQPEFWVLLGDISREVAESLARQNSNIYAVILVERNYRLVPPVQVGNAVMLSAVERGRHLGKLTVTLSEAGEILSYRPESIELDSRVLEDSAFLEKARAVARVVGGAAH